MNGVPEIGDRIAAHQRLGFSREEQVYDSGIS